MTDNGAMCIVIGVILALGVIAFLIDKFKK